MDITTEVGALLDSHHRRKNKVLLFDITIVNPCASFNLESEACHTRTHHADAIEGTKNKYLGSSPVTYSLVRVAMSTYCEADSDVHALLLDLGIRRVQHKPEMHSNESQHLAEGTEVARLWWQPSFVLHQAFLFRTRHHLYRQGAALAGSQQLCLQDSAHVHAYCTVGGTVPEELKGAKVGGNGIGGGTGTGTMMGTGTGQEWEWRWI